MSTTEASRPSYWSRRITRNAFIGAASGALTAIVYALARDKASAAFRWSMATGYASVALLGLALVLGPWWVLRGRRVPVSTDLRRDIGIWGALLGLAHVVTGLKVHMAGDMFRYFVYRAEDGAHAFPIRIDPFGITNWTGLAATGLLVFLLAISNNRSLRALGTTRWKRWQRWTYVALALVALHGLAFQLMDKRAMAFKLVFAALIIAVGTMQLVGRARVRASRRAAP